MYHAFWYDEDGEHHHLESENLNDIVAYFGGDDSAKEVFRKQYQPTMQYGAILIQGNELIWNFDGPASEYKPEDFTPDFEPGEEPPTDDETP